MDAPLFPQAQTSNVYYCNLIGMVDSTSFDTLMNRLALLCQQNPEELGNPIRHFTREAVFARRKQPLVNQGGGMPTGMHYINPSELRVQRRSMHTETNAGQWSLHYYGASISRSDFQSHCRPVVEVEVNQDIESFLEAMDYEYQFEYLMEGWRFCGIMDNLNRPIYVHIYQIRIVNERGKLVEATGQLFDDLVMEVSAYARDDDMAQVTKELSVFANRLIPIINLTNLNPATKKEIDRVLRARNTDHAAGSQQNLRNQL